ncbi:hypothetical protein Tco_0593404 [Tanacetum coccineum]
MLDPSPEFIGHWGTSVESGLPIVVRPLQSSASKRMPFTLKNLTRSLGITRPVAYCKNLGYSEWSTPAGLKLARENLQSRVKEEDSITDVENAIFDLGVMDSLCFLFIDQRVFIGMITKFIKFIELNFSVITRGFDIKVVLLASVSAGSASLTCALRTAPTAKSLASHMISKGKSKWGATRIGACEEKESPKLKIIHEELPMVYLDHDHERLQPYTFGTCPVHCITQKACDDRQMSRKGRIFTSCASLQSSQPKFCSRLRKWTVSENMLLCCVPDTAYGPHPIRRISEKFALAVEIDLTWSRGFVFVELGRLPNLLSCKTLLICPISDSAINVISDSSRLGLRSGYKEFPLFRW